MVLDICKLTVCGVIIGDLDVIDAYYSNGTLEQGLINISSIFMGKGRLALFEHVDRLLPTIWPRLKLELIGLNEDAEAVKFVLRHILSEVTRRRAIAVCLDRANLEAFKVMVSQIVYIKDLPRTMELCLYNGSYNIARYLVSYFKEAIDQPWFRTISGGSYYHILASNVSHTQRDVAALIEDMVAGGIGGLEVLDMTGHTPYVTSIITRAGPHSPVTRCLAALLDRNGEAARTIMSEQEVAQVRYRVYFASSLVVKLLRLL